MKVHKVTVIVMDTDRIGDTGVRAQIEGAQFSVNHVIDSHTVDVTWGDDHPLNNSATFRDALAALFPAHEPTGVTLTAENAPRARVVEDGRCRLWVRDEESAAPRFVLVTNDALRMDAHHLIANCGGAVVLAWRVQP